MEKGRERDDRREKENERTGGDGGKSEGGSQALARPVMIDWLAGSQQTDVRPPDQPIHPRANPPLLPDPPPSTVSSCSLSLSLFSRFSRSFTWSNLYRHRHQNHRPWSTGLLKKLVIQCTLSLFFSFSSISFFLLPLFLIPTSLFSSAVHRTLSRLSSVIATLSTLFSPERDPSRCGSRA